MTNETEEKKEVEVLEPETTEETEETEDDDEIVVPPPDEEETEERSVKELDIEEGTEEEEQTEDTEETDEEVPPQPKPVKGETEKEQILRKKLEEAREKLRQKDKVIEIAQPTISEEEYEKLKEIYTDEELKKVEHLFDVIGKKKGYVRVEEIQKEKGQEVVNTFIEKHPEYSLQNDPDDLRWSTFVRILQNDYNRHGKTPKELARIFEKVHIDVKNEFGESLDKSISPKFRNAQKQKVRIVSHTGGTKSTSGKKSNAPTDPKIRAMFKDFDDDDF